MVKGICLWTWSVVYRDSWWKKNPKQWKEISKDKSQLIQAVPFDKLPEKYKKKGTPIHAIRCKICGDKWFSTCKLPLCKRLECWIKYYGGNHYVRQSTKS